MNKLLASLIISGNPFSVVRIGNSEGFFLLNDFKKRPVKEFESCLSYAGLFEHIARDLISNTIEREKWFQLNFEAITNSDAVGFVDISEQIKNNIEFLKLYCNRKYLFFKKQIDILDPGFLQTLSDPWTQHLKNKKVLVISNFEKTIKQQWQNIDKVWGSKLDAIAPFKLVDVIRSPFHSSIDSRQYVNDGSYSGTIEHMKKLMDSIEYDIALISAGSLAPPLAYHAKSMGKGGITICGSLQLFFGILGSRWVNNPDFQKWNEMYNDHWVWPLKEDLPENQSGINSGKISYWK